jgi:glycosyltransferase involved in cell wall biosynthesis
MKILVISPSLPSPSNDMRGVRSNEQFRLLGELGHDVRAVVPVPWTPPGVPRASWQRRRRIPSVEMDHDVAIAHPRFLAMGPAKRLPGAAVVQRALYWRALRPEVESFVRSGGAIVHVHSCGLPGVVLDRVRPARSVVSMWDHELFDLAPGHRGWERAIASSLRRADAVVYISDALRKAGEALAGPHSARVIPLAIDEFPDIVPIPSPHFSVVTVARLIERKQIALLIDSFDRLLAEAPEARLTIVGYGPERVRLEQQAERHGIRHAVEFTGRLPQREVRERMARAHVFVLPSVRESLGTVYFEAMSMKVPVVGVRGEAIADHVTDGVDGFLIEAGDGAALLDILRLLHRDPARRVLVGERGRALFERSGVRWPDYVAAHVALFESLV